MFVSLEIHIWNLPAHNLFYFSQSWCVYGALVCALNTLLIPVEIILRWLYFSQEIFELLPRDGRVWKNRYSRAVIIINHLKTARVVHQSLIAFKTGILFGRFSNITMHTARMPQRQCELRAHAGNVQVIILRVVQDDLCSVCRCELVRWAAHIVCLRYKWIDLNIGWLQNGRSSSPPLLSLSPCVSPWLYQSLTCCFQGNYRSVSKHTPAREQRRSCVEGWDVCVPFCVARLSAFSLLLSPPPHTSLRIKLALLPGAVCVHKGFNWRRWSG